MDLSKYTLRTDSYGEFGDLYRITSDGCFQKQEITSHAYPRVAMQPDKKQEWDDVKYTGDILLHGSKPDSSESLELTVLIESGEVQEFKKPY